jgi:hypothetical protein
VCLFPTRGDVWVERGQDNGYTRKESRDTLSADLRARQRSPLFDFRPFVSSPGLLLGRSAVCLAAKDQL